MFLTSCGSFMYVKGREGAMAAVVGVIVVAAAVVSPCEPCWLEMLSLRLRLGYCALAGDESGTEEVQLTILLRCWHWVDRGC